MKKTIKFLLAALLMSLMFSCIVVEYDRETTIYNETGYTINYLYVIPADEYPTYGFYDYSDALEYFSTYEEDQLGNTTLSDGSYVTVNLDNIDPFADEFVAIGFDYSDMSYREFYGSNTSITLRSSDWVSFY